jgi:hypothetical protein
MLSKYAPDGQFDWTNPDSIVLLLQQKSFFKRFSSDQLKSHLFQATVSCFKKNESVFLKGRVGVVYAGGVEVRLHECTEMLDPLLVKKAIEGDILGFA